MIYIISFYIIAIVIIHILLFTKATYMSRIVLINSAISCLAVAMLLLTYYFKDNNFIDVIFFYIIMSPIGFYGIFLYYKYSFKKKVSKIEQNDNMINQSKTDMLKELQIENHKIEKYYNESKNISTNTDNKKGQVEYKQKQNSFTNNNFKKEANKHKRNVDNKQKNKL